MTTVTRTRDPSGFPIVLVPLKDGVHTVVVDAEDYDRLISRGISPVWCANMNGRRDAYVVRVSGNGIPGDPLAVARLIMDAPAGTIVRRKDGDAFNLRRANLTLRRGRSKGREIVALRIAGKQAEAAAHAVPEVSGPPYRQAPRILPNLAANAIRRPDFPEPKETYSPTINAWLRRQAAKYVPEALSDPHASTPDQGHVE